MILKKTDIKSFLIKIQWLLSTQFGIDPISFIKSIRGIPIFVSDLYKFKKAYKGKILFKPCLHDRYDEGGKSKSEYFLQDLIVARLIYNSKPIRHVDIGSRVDGFVAHVASFREIEVYDVRPISTMIPGIIFKKADLMQSNECLSEGGEYCDSLSCLHAIEHFGLGRYGDSINPKGYELGIANMAKLLKMDGHLYLSTPIGQMRVEFNANYVYDPRKIIECAASNGLDIQKMIIIEPSGEVKEVEPCEETLRELANITYNLGVFIFVKKKKIKEAYHLESTLPKQS